MLQQGKLLATSSECRENAAHAAICWVPEKRWMKEEKAEGDMAGYISKIHERDGCHLPWSPHDCQWPRQMETSRRSMLREEQAELILNELEAASACYTGQGP